MYPVLPLKDPLTLSSWAGLWAAAVTVGSHGFSIMLTGPYFILIVDEIFLVFVNRLWGHILYAYVIVL